MDEIWKDVKGYEGFYQVSNLGRIRSLDHYASNGVSQILYKGKIRKLRIQPNGYVYLNLSDGKNVQKRHYVHRLVAKAFIPNPENKPEINHKDENKQNNCADNLEWCTRKENWNYNNLPTRVGLLQRGIVRNNKPIEQLTLDGKVVASFESAIEAQRKTGIDFSHIRKVVRGIDKSAGGYKWREKLK